MKNFSESFFAQVSQDAQEHLPLIGELHRALKRLGDSCYMPTAELNGAMRNLISAIDRVVE